MIKKGDRIICLSSASIFMTVGRVYLAASGIEAEPDPFNREEELEFITVVNLDGSNLAPIRGNFRFLAKRFKKFRQFTINKQTKII